MVKTHDGMENKLQMMMTNEFSTFISSYLSAPTIHMHVAAGKMSQDSYHHDHFMSSFFTVMGWTFCILNIHIMEPFVYSNVS